LGESRRQTPTHSLTKIGSTY